MGLSFIAQYQTPLPISKEHIKIESLCLNSKVDKGMNIVFESYSDNLVTSPDEIDNWIKNL